MTDELIIGRYYWVRFSKDGDWDLSQWAKWCQCFDRSRCGYDGLTDIDPVQWIIIPSLEELLSAQVGEMDTLVIDRHYWVQFWEDGTRQVGQWSENKHYDTQSFDTEMFEQDWSHLDPDKWVMIPSPEELLSIRAEV